jgi:fatty-acyl-CoA synthase
VSNPRSSTVDTVMQRSARRFPNRTALIFEDRTWTYRELDDAVTRGAAALRQQGLESGDRVAAFGRNSDAYLIAFLACSRAGLVHVPINYALVEDELAYLLDQSGSRAILYDPKLGDVLTRVDPTADFLMTLRGTDDSFLTAASSGPVPELDIEVSDADIAQLLYTSGTTSHPKGAVMTHRALVHEYVSAVLALECQADEHPLHPMPLYHSAGMHVFLMPYLSVGATNTLMETPDIPEVLRRIEQDKLTAVFLAPTVWVPLSQHPDFAIRDLSSLQKAFYGASVMPAPVLERLQKALPDLGFYNCYGQSEIGPLATVLGPREHQGRSESCGRSVMFVDLRVVDSTGNDVPPGEIGEIVYRSPQLCEGYWGKPEESEEAFRDGWFHSGDLVRVDEEGYVTIVDRIKDVINTGGVLVASRHVEDEIYTHPAVSEVAVIATPDDRWIEAVTAFVVLKDSVKSVTPDEIIEHTKGRLAPHARPKKVYIVDSLPRNQSGKLLKRLLRQDD